MLIFRGTSGLNNRIDPARLVQDPETGQIELAVAVNVTIDETGRLSRKKGYTSVAAGSFHSLFCDKGDCLVVAGDALCILERNLGTRALRNVTEGARLRCVQVEDTIYYTNGHEKGYVWKGLSRAWGQGTYDKDDLRAIGYWSPETSKAFIGPPIGAILEYHNGRMYVAQDNVLWVSERFQPALFDAFRNHFRFASNITMVRSVADGLWVSDESAVYFLSGHDPDQFQQTEMTTYPAVLGTDVMVDSQKLGFEGLQGRAVVFTATSPRQDEPGGVCIAASGGMFYNLTQERIDLPYSREGAAVMRGNQYLVTLQP
jgi:hypothetical protein